MSSKAVMMMIIIRTDRSYDDLSPTLRSRMQLMPACIPLRLQYVNIWLNVRTDEMSSDHRSVCSVSRQPPDTGGVWVPAAAQECNRRNSSNIMDIRARSARLLHRKVIPDGRALRFHSFYSTLCANSCVQSECMQHISRNQPGGISGTRWWRLPAKHTLVMAFTLQDPWKGMNSVN